MADLHIYMLRILYESFEEKIYFCEKKFVEKEVLCTDFCVKQGNSPFFTGLSFFFYIQEEYGVI